jgi:hypothetical protein
MNAPRKWIGGLLISSMTLAPLIGCEQLPGNKKTQGAVIGGAGGALAGALIAKNNRLLGGLIGGALGAAGGYVIGAQLEKNDKNHHDEAIKASDRDRENPPTESDVRRARTADLNGDGFVTLNEVVAMNKAGLSSREMINRLEDTGQVFYLSGEQEDYLRDKGVPAEVIRAMRTMNRDRERELDRERASDDRRG